MRREKDPNAIRRRLQRLAEMVQAVEDRGAGGIGDADGRGGPNFRGRGRRAVAAGWPEVDDALVSPQYGEKSPMGAGRCPPLRGLLRGAVHEWFGLAEANVETSKRRNVKILDGGEGDGTRPPGRSRERGNPISGGWMPPVCVLAHLAWQALVQDDHDAEAAPGSCASEISGGSGAGYVVWIGQRIRPYPHLLLRGRPPVERFASSRQSTANARDRLLLERSLFIDPPDDGTRLWAIDLALRCTAVCAVIADGCGLSMAQTRRLQLAAEAGEALVLLARPPEEERELSAAMTRWRIAPAPSSTDRPRWSITLLRRKGARGGLNVTAAGRARAPRPPAVVEEPHHERNGTLPGTEAGMRHWLLEWNHVQGVVAVPADVVDRSREAPPALAADERGKTAEPGGGARRTA